MPTTYAHFKLGQEVRKRATPQVASIIEEHPGVFQIGLHGPDILFYYKALSKNKVNSMGHHLHELSGEHFFENAAAIIKQYGYQKSHISYILGFLCHFALDVTCHGFVNSQVRAGIASHLEIEAELDRELLLQDGKNPERAILTGHIKATEKNTGIIGVFFPELSLEEIQKSISDMIFYLNLLVAKGIVKRNILYTSLKLVGKYDTYKGLIINKEKNKKCEACTYRLLELFQEGKELALGLLDEYVDYLYGIKSLNSIYKYNFDSILLEEN